MDPHNKMDALAGHKISAEEQNEVTGGHYGFGFGYGYGYNRGYGHSYYGGGHRITGYAAPVAHSYSYTPAAVVYQPTYVALPRYAGYTAPSHYGYQFGSYSSYYGGYGYRRW